MSKPNGVPNKVLWFKKNSGSSNRFVTISLTDEVKEMLLNGLTKGLWKKSDAYTLIKKAIHSHPTQGTKKTRIILSTLGKKAGSCLGF